MLKIVKRPISIANLLAAKERRTPHSAVANGTLVGVLVPRILQLEGELAAWKTKSGIDELTGLTNFEGFNRGFNRMFEVAVRNGEALTYLRIDLDSFDQLNKWYGNDVGDEVLKAVAEVLKVSIRAGDIAGRVAGNQFNVALQTTGYLDASRVANRIVTDVRESRFDQYPELRILVTVGGQCMEYYNRVSKGDRRYWRSNWTPEQLKNRTDTAMGTVRAAGGNQSCVLTDSRAVDKSHG